MITRNENSFKFLLNRIDCLHILRLGKSPKSESPYGVYRYEYIYRRSIHNVRPRLLAPVGREEIRTWVQRKFASLGSRKQRSPSIRNFRSIAESEVFLVYFSRNPAYPRTAVRRSRGVTQFSAAFTPSAGSSQQARDKESRRLKNEG